MVVRLRDVLVTKGEIGLHLKNRLRMLRERIDKTRFSWRRKRLIQEYVRLLWEVFG